MNYVQRLNDALDYAVDTNYDVWNRQNDIRKDIYSHKNVVVLGTGEFFDDCAIPMHLLRFEYCGDNNPAKWGKSFKGRKCLSPQEIAALDDAAVIIMIGTWGPIYEQLKGMGICCYPMDWYSLNVYDTHYSNSWFAKRREKIIEGLNLFEDDLSREVYTEAICNRIAPPLAQKTFDEIKIPGEYFESGIFEMSDEEYIVEAGAYTGDSIEKFYKLKQEKYGAIYAFELDPAIFEELKKNVKNYDNGNIELYNYGVSDSYSEFDYNYIQGTRSHKAKVGAIDELLIGKKVTYIKMDVETYELRALEGAKNMITTQQPKLCISAYHYLSDLWEVPHKIKSLVSGYKLYLRHHSPCVWDTDCYAYK